MLKLRYDYATEVYDAQQLNEEAPPPFKAWALEQGYEVSDDEGEMEPVVGQDEIGDDQVQAPGDQTAASLPTGQDQPELTQQQ